MIPNISLNTYAYKHSHEYRFYARQKKFFVMLVFMYSLSHYTHIKQCMDNKVQNKCIRLKLQ